MSVLFSLIDAGLAFGAHPLLDGAAFTLTAGERLGLIGRNGTGKSSLLNVIAGRIQLDDGRAVVRDGLRIVLVEQEPVLPPADTLFESLLARGTAAGLVDERDERRYWALQARLRAELGRFGVDPEVDPEGLSGGQNKRAALALAFALEPDLLLLDEPTNHLDAESVDWLEQFLQKFTGTVVAVTHDRYFLDNAAEWILELDRGSGIPWRGNYSSWLDQKSNRLKQEEAAESARQKALKKELEWVRQNAKGRQAKSKARLARFDELSSYEYQRRNETQEIFIPVAERLGDQVIEFQNVSKAYGDRLLIDNLSFQIPPGAIVGIIGPNGAGKSTIFRMITGREKPDSGEIKIGHTVHIAYVDQSRESLQGDKTVWEDVSGGLDIMNVGKFEMQSRAYIGRFNFKGPDQQKLVGQLSGGERGRLHLAKTLLEGGNVLLLDEPSNDLDVETLRALEDALLEFAGCCLVISHDRWFLDRIATHILAAEGDSQWTFFAGNYREYEEDKRRRLGDEEARPKRFRYKSIHV